MKPSLNGNFINLRLDSLFTLSKNNKRLFKVILNMQISVRDSIVSQVVIRLDIDILRFMNCALL